MKPTTDLERFIRVSFEDIGILTSLEKDLQESIEYQGRDPEGYSEEEWDKLLTKHNVEG